MIRVAAIQMVSGPKVQDNLREAEKLINQACAKGARLILLPENFALIGKHDSDILAHMEKIGEGQIQDFLERIAKQNNAVIIAGSVPISTNDSNKIRPALLVYNENGERIARYDKIHLFDVHIPESEEKYLESSTFEPGDEICVVDTSFGRLGLSICYDLRFPELYRLLGEQDAEILLVPAAFTAVTGEVHWHTLLKARAIENQCYVIAAAQGGVHINGRETYGHSMIIEPWGSILDELDTGAGYVISDIDLDKLKNLRKRFPVLSHRKYFCKNHE